ncbi:hypothetical protein GCM10008025_24920 [Ornithinibacillus halotolerans]|uniref:Uncharacterized protein n=1 Tax=Ornithinibacillus halotolerans TaxID=1274357 RepID=A0A916S1V7_9BACI|nr:hypothetical protein GCM10008025_24920 [Ornithinibacillus halotolerans]
MSNEFVEQLVIQKELCNSSNKYDILRTDIRWGIIMKVEKSLRICERGNKYTKVVIVLVAQLVIKKLSQKVVFYQN